MARPYRIIKDQNGTFKTQIKCRMEGKGEVGPELDLKIK